MTRRKFRLFNVLRVLSEIAARNVGRQIAAATAALPCIPHSERERTRFLAVAVCIRLAAELRDIEPRASACSVWEGEA